MCSLLATGDPLFVVSLDPCSSGVAYVSGIVPSKGVVRACLQWVPWCWVQCPFPDNAVPASAKSGPPCRRPDLQGPGSEHDWQRVIAFTWGELERLCAIIKRRGGVTDAEYWNCATRCAAALRDQVRTGAWSVCVTADSTAVCSVLSPEQCHARGLPSLPPIPFACMDFECSPRMADTDYTRDIQCLYAVHLLFDDGSGHELRVSIVARGYSPTVLVHPDATTRVCDTESSMCAAVANEFRVHTPLCVYWLGAEAHALKVWCSRMYLWGSPHGPVCWRGSASQLYATPGHMNLLAALHAERSSTPTAADAVPRTPPALSPGLRAKILAWNQQDSVVAVTGATAYTPVADTSLQALSVYRATGPPPRTRATTANGGRVPVRFSVYIPGRVCADLAHIVYGDHKRAVDCRPATVCQLYGLSVDATDRLGVMSQLVAKRRLQSMQMRFASALCTSARAAIGTGIMNAMQCVLLSIADAHGYVVYFGPTARVAQWNSAVVGGGDLISSATRLHDTTAVGMVDVRRMYPSIVLASNVCWTTVDPATHDIVPTSGPGLLSRCMQSIGDARDRAQCPHEVQTFKLLQSALYGCLASPVFFAPGIVIASIITARGRQLLAQLCASIRDPQLYPQTPLHELSAETQSDWNSVVQCVTAHGTVPQCVAGQTDSVRYTLPFTVADTGLPVARYVVVAWHWNAAFLTRIQRVLGPPFSLAHEGILFPAWVYRMEKRSAYGGWHYESVCKPPVLKLVGFPFSFAASPAFIRTLMYDALCAVLAGRPDAATTVLKTGIHQLQTCQVPLRDLISNIKLSASTPSASNELCPTVQVISSPAHPLRTATVTRGCHTPPGTRVDTHSYVRLMVKYAACIGIDPQQFHETETKPGAARNDAPLKRPIRALL